LLLPIDGGRFNQPRYAWPTRDFSEVHSALFTTLLRSLRSRRVAHYGAKRIMADLHSTELIAHALARHIPYEISHACLMQRFLPFLWREGVLGGRTFDVLATRLPLRVLHGRLDMETAKHPERKTLAEFRAPEMLVQAEEEALAAAERIITPHAEIAELFGNRAVLLPWAMPSAACQVRNTRTLPRCNTSTLATVAFPGPTAARKGAYELREAAHALDLEILLLGSELEGEDFWHGVKTR